MMDHEAQTSVRHTWQKQNRLTALMTSKMSEDLFLDLIRNPANVSHLFYRTPSSQ